MRRERTGHGGGGGGGGGGTTGVPAVTQIGAVLTGTGIGPAATNSAWLPPVTDNFLISTFQVGGGATLILAGGTLVNPAGTASYSSPPDSAANSEVITNTAAIQSPKDVSATPTAFAYVGTFSFPTVGSTVTWTLTAHWDTGIFSHAKTFTIIGADNVWSGVGTAGATGINGTTGVLVGATGTLTATLSQSGKVAFSPSPANQKLYYVGPAGLTFHDGNNILIPMTSSVISVTNSHGVVTTRTLYESVNLLSSITNPVTPS